MGLLERLIAEGEEEARKKAEEAKNNPVETTPRIAHTARSDAEWREAHEQRMRKIAEWEAKQDPDKKVVHLYRTGKQMLDISCPACKAERGKPCVEVPGEWGQNYLPPQARHSNYPHHGRIRAFAVCEGIHPEDLMKEPYRSWPYASRYRRWAVFKTSTSSGETRLHKRWVKKLKVMDCHIRAQQKADREQEASRLENLKKTGYHYGGDRYAIAPVVKVGETWIRWDLAHEELKESA